MQSWPWRMMVFLGLAVAFIYAATRNDPELSFVEQATPTQLIERLDHTRESVRRAAASQLVAQGSRGVPVMLDAIPQANNEQLSGIFFVLEDLYLSGDDEVYDIVEAALDTLMEDRDYNIRQSAERILTLNASRRHSRAYTKLVAAGGKFESTNPNSAATSESDHQGNLLILGPEWTGGAEELNAIRHVRQLHAVHVAKAASINTDEILRMRKSLPYVIVRCEGEPCLGIECYLAREELEIARVVPGSPAERAGLRRFDEIVELNGMPAGNAAEFFEQLRRYSFGDQVVVRLLRNRQELSLPVTLDTDFGTGRCWCTDQGESSQSPAEYAAIYSMGRQLHHSTDRIIRPTSHRVSRNR